jgi:GntR family transcriptional regulator
VEEINLQEDSPIPLYYQLENEIRRKIEAGDYQPGDKIPSERELSDKVNLSRMTIRKAISNLVEKGILERRRGQGTFVSEDKVNTFPGLIGFNEHMELKEMTPSSEVIEQELLIPNHEISSRLKVEEGKVILTARLRLGNEEPIGYEKSYVPYSVCPQLLEVDLEEGSIYHCLQEAGYKPIKAEQETEAILADRHLADLLEVEVDQPILKNTRVTFSKTKPVEFSYNFYRGDKYSIYTELNT